MVMASPWGLSSLHQTDWVWVWTWVRMGPQKSSASVARVVVRVRIKSPASCPGANGAALKSGTCAPAQAVARIDGRPIQALYLARLGWSYSCVVPVGF